MKKKLFNLYDFLLNRYGPQMWWPADSSFEVCVGAVLTQNTSWSNVEKAILNLKSSGFLLSDDKTDSENLLTTQLYKIEELIRPSGYFRQKAVRIHNIAKWWIENTVDSRLKTPFLSSARNSLLSVNGIGPETADTILLYAFDKPVFVIDAYTKRVSSVYLNTPTDIDYSFLQTIFMSNLPPDFQLFNEFHALIVALAKEKEYREILSRNFHNC